MQCPEATSSSEPEVDSAWGWEHSPIWRRQPGAPYNTEGAITVWPAGMARRDRIGQVATDSASARGNAWLIDRSGASSEEAPGAEAETAEGESGVKDLVA